MARTVRDDVTCDERPYARMNELFLERMRHNRVILWWFCLWGRSRETTLDADHYRYTPIRRSCITLFIEIIRSSPGSLLRNRLLSQHSGQFDSIVCLNFATNFGRARNAKCNQVFIFNPHLATIATITATMTWISYWSFGPSWDALSVQKKMQ